MWIIYVDNLTRWFIWSSSIFILICWMFVVLSVVILFVYYLTIFLGLGKWCLAPLSINNILTVSFIGGGNRSTRGRPPTSRMSLTLFFLIRNIYFNTKHSYLFGICGNVNIIPRSEINWCILSKFNIYLHRRKE